MDEMMQESANYAFLKGGGEMGELTRRMDWSKTPLGSPAGWPSCLRSSVSILLNSQFPMFVWWGKELITLYNDAYRVIAGDKHPALLGKSGREGWAEIWPDLSPLVDHVFQGAATWSEDLPLYIKRSEEIEETYFTFSYSPVIDDEGKVGGLFCACIETTAKVTSVRDLKKSKELLQKSEARFRALIEEAPVPTAVFTGRELRIDVANESMLKVWGKGNGVIGMTLADALPELDGQPFLQILDDVFTSGTMYEAKAVKAHLVVDGEPGVYYFDVIYKPLFNELGEVYAIMDMAVDVTEQVGSRQLIEQSENRFRALATASSDVVYRLNADWTILYPLDGRGFLPDAENPIEDWMEKNVHPSEMDRLKTAIAAAIADKSVFELEHMVVKADGESGWTFSRAVPILNEEGEIVEWFGTATDISIRKMIEQSLKESENRFRIMVEQAQIPIAMTKGPEMVLEAINTPMLEAIGKTGIDVLHKRVYDVLPELQKQMVTEILRHVWETGTPFTGQEIPIMIIKNGEQVEKYYNISYTPVAPEGEMMYIIHLAVDVTEQVMARHKIEEVVAMRTKELSAANETLSSLNKELTRSNQNLEEFAHAASHDLKEPVRKIHYFTEHLKEQIGDSIKENLKQDFNRIEKATERMRNLIDDLLLYSHVSQRPHEKEDIDLNRKVQLVMEDLELDIAEKNAVVDVGPLPVVKGYRRQLQQVFQNLLSNALKYSREGVTPHIHISASEATENGKQYYVLTVRDNGIGFDQQYSEKIFQMFARLHGRNEYSGTGVGLSIVKKVVENHNGMIRVESTPGVGSSFSILLPVG